MNIRNTNTPLPTLNSLHMGFSPDFECKLAPVQFQTFVPLPPVESIGKFEFTFDFSSEDSCDYSDCDTFISCSYDL